jgi:hypothetical protein
MSLRVRVGDSLIDLLYPNMTFDGGIDCMRRL